MTNIVDPHQLEQKTPMPVSQSNPGNNPKRSDPIDEIKNAYYEGEKLKAFQHAMGFAGQATSKEELQKMINEMGSNTHNQSNELMMRMLESQTNAFTTILGHVAAGQKGEQSELQKFMIEEIKSMREKTDNALANKADPLSTLFENAEKFDGFLSTLKGKLGVSDSPATRADLPALMQLEELRNSAQDSQRRFELEMEERRRQHEETMEEKRRRWAIEDKQFDINMRIELAKLKNDGERKDAMFEQLRAGLNAVFDGIEPEGAAGREKRRTMDRASRERIEEDQVPISFKCENCGTTIEPGDKTSDIKCPTCGEIYDFEAV